VAWSQGIGYAVVKWGKVLDTIVGESDEDKDGMDEEGNVGDGNSWQSRKEVAVLIVKDQRGRMAFAVEML
jgi:hypothetical protein